MFNVPPAKQNAAYSHSFVSRPSVCLSVCKAVINSVSHTLVLWHHMRSAEHLFVNLVYERGTAQIHVVIWFKQYLLMNLTQVNIFTESVGIEQQE